MKELSIEEKAKAYDEAYKKVAVRFGSNVADEIFLKESEGERIRNFISNELACLRAADEKGTVRYNELTEAIAWVEKQGEKDEEILVLKDQIESLHAAIKAIKETHRIELEKQGEQKHFNNNFPSFDEAQGTVIVEKQGEQKPADKVKAKFNVGDWVVLTAGQLEAILRITAINFKKKQYWFNDDSYLPIVDEDCLRLWTIQDAKDGDVLCCESGWTCIFKALDNHTNTFSSYCFMDNTKWFCETGYKCHTLKEEFSKVYNGKIYPATKEQRDALMKAMADAGYTFDFEKKELKKIEQKLTDDIERKYNPCYNMSFEEAQGYISNRGFDVPWTDCDVFVDFRYITQTVANILRWADNNPKHNPAWSEEDDQYLLICKNALAKYQVSDKWDATIISRWLEDKLNSLKERVQPQLKQEWSEEDETNLSEALFHIRMYNLANKADILDKWLKSLKYRYTWKPSIAQLNALSIVSKGNAPDDIEAIVSLYNDLKKLKEE